MVKEQKLHLMGANIQENGSVGTNMDMGPTLGQMEKNILGGGRKGSNMEKGHFFFQMELRSQESSEKTSHGK